MSDTTEAFVGLDAGLWSLAVALTGLAVWLARPRAQQWDTGRFFAAAWKGGGDLLGDTYDPRAILGPACSWPALAAWTPEAVAVISRRLGRARCLWLGPVAMDLPVLASVSIEPSAAGVATLPDEADLRYLVAGTSIEVLQLLHELPGLRDRTRMVLLVGADAGAHAEWLAASFTHEGFDLELARTIAYCTLRVGPGQELPVPHPSPTGRVAIEVVDLGYTDTPRELSLSRALVTTFAAVLAG